MKTKKRNIKKIKGNRKSIYKLKEGDSLPNHLVVFEDYDICNNKIKAYIIIWTKNFLRYMYSTPFIKTTY